MSKKQTRNLKFGIVVKFNMPKKNYVKNRNDFPANF